LSWLSSSAEAFEAGHDAPTTTPHVGDLDDSTAVDRPNPLSYDQARRLRGARLSGPPPRPSVEPITVRRRASNSGVITVTG
jgi:hypothetical protein